MYIYMYMCMYVYICVYMYICGYMYICMYYVYSEIRAGYWVTSFITFTVSINL